MRASARRRRREGTSHRQEAMTTKWVRGERYERPTTDDVSRRAMV
jgi:hypothetical protein